MFLPPCAVNNTSQRMPTSTTEQLVKGGHADISTTARTLYFNYLYFKIFDAIFFLFFKKH